MKNYLLSIVISITFLSCNQKIKEENLNSADRRDETNSLQIINLEEAFNDPKQVNLSEIADTISYVPLENSNDIFLNKILDVKLTASYIFVRDDKKLLQFDRRGKFVRQIGGVGKGPGEYVSIIHFDANEKADLILIQDEPKLLKYDCSGNYKTTKTKQYGIEFMIFNSGKIAFYQDNDINDPTNLTVSDLNFKKLISFDNSFPNPKRNPGFSISPLYIFKNRLHFKEHYNDSIFRLINNKLEPHLIVKEEGLLLPSDFDIEGGRGIAYIEQQLNKVKNKLVAKEIFESNDFVFLSYLKGLHPRNIEYANFIFEKKYGNTIALKSGKFKNDIDGGVDFWPRLVFEDNILIDYIEAYEFKEIMRSNKKHNLPEHLSGINENDNPVIMFVELSKVK